MWKLSLIAFALLAVSAPAAAASAATGSLNLTTTMVGLAAILIFVLAYLLVMGEEHLKMRKSKPVLVAAGLIWMLIGYTYMSQGLPDQAAQAFRVNLLAFSELLLFLIVTMTYINAMEERRLFDALRAWMVKKGFSYRQLFWLSGCLAFVISSVVDNLTNALLMSAVIMKVAEGDKKFISMASVSIVIAANAGGSSR